MSTVNLTINGKRYEVGCEDGAEAQLEALGEMVDARARHIAAEGSSSDTRLMLLAALVLADEYTLAAGRVAAAEAAAKRLEGDLANIEIRAAEVIESAVRRIDSIGADWD
jgi:cell division protein ZapA